MMVKDLNHNLISIIGSILSRDYFIYSYRTVEIHFTIIKEIVHIYMHNFFSDSVNYQSRVLSISLITNAPDEASNYLRHGAYIYMCHVISGVVSNELKGSGIE